MFKGFVGILLGLMFSLSYADNNPPRTVDHVDLQKYLGKWYEIAAFPNLFEKGCRCTTAEYRAKGQKIIVINRCIKKNTNRLSVATGSAWPVKGSNNSKLKVQFFWPFRGDYWILNLSPTYQDVLVGSPNRKYLWILARQPAITKARYEEILEVARREGFNLQKLVATDQSCKN